jgi:hypothetical protein
MTEEVKIEIPQEETKSESPAVENKTVETTQIVESSPYEEAARAQGWVSKEEWVESGRAADEWRPAKEFVDRGELYKSIHQTKRELKQTQVVLENLQRHHQMVYEKAYQQALNDLKMQKRQAIREQDFEAAEDIDEKIDTLKEQRQQEQQQLVMAQRQAVQVGPPPEFQAFIDRNPWYLSDKGMRDDADAAGFIFLNNGGSKENLLTHVEAQMRKKYPEKFGTTKRAAPNAVAPTQRTGKSASSAETELDDNEREVMRTFVRMGVMTEQQYREELKKAKGRS